MGAASGVPHRIHWIWSAFKVFDTNGDGFIDLDELGELLSSLGIEAKDDDKRKMLSALSCVSGRTDGVMNIDELAKVLMSSGGCNMSFLSGNVLLTQVFDKLDENNNGLVEYAELFTLVRMFTEDAPSLDFDSLVHNIMTEADKDDSGMVRMPTRAARARTLPHALSVVLWSCVGARTAR